MRCGSRRSAMPSCSTSGHRRSPRLRLTHDDFAVTNPHLVTTSVTAFGQSGPYAEWSATNLTSYATGGQHYLTGDADREPMQNGGYQALYQAGTWAFGATLTAIGTHARPASDNRPRSAGKK